MSLVPANLEEWLRTGHPCHPPAKRLAKRCRKDRT